MHSFSIITTVVNDVTKQIGHHRSQVILEKKGEQKWLDDSLPLEEVLGLLKPYPGNDFKDDPVSICVKDPKNKGRDLLIPVYHGSTTQYDSTVKKDLKLEGMGRNRRKEDPLGRQGKLF